VPLNENIHTTSRKGRESPFHDSRIGSCLLDGEIGFDLQEYDPMIILLAWARERPDATHCFTSCVLADFIRVCGSSSEPGN